ncbi:universal stress protein [Sciscionella sediminilitoris]|uniref:universal stress protein n=1 Tax=Sciscionella sediminilitoris TaxID=1445613 RepID=UPI0004DFC84C|nr:universal stress protein [Sciscionella sp. SE31]
MSGVANDFERGTDGPKLILAGIDESDSAMRAAAYAGGLARRQGAELALVYVRPIVSSTATFAAETVKTGEAIAEDLEKYLTEAVESRGGTEGYGVRWRFLVRAGDPYRELVAAAEELTADAVVVGASESVGHRVIGSIAVRLVRAGRWPVTVVP